MPVGKRSSVADIHRARLGAFEISRKRENNPTPLEQAEVLRQIAQRQGTHLRHVNRTQFLTLLALLSNVSNVAAASRTPCPQYHAPGSTEAADAIAPQCNYALFAADGARKTQTRTTEFNVTGYVRNDFRAFCIETNQSPSGKRRHACSIRHIERIKRSTDGNTIYAIGQHRREPINVLAMHSMRSTASEAQYFSIYTKDRLRSDTISTYTMTLGVDGSRNGTIDFMTLHERPLDADWRRVLSVGRNSHNSLVITRPGLDGHDVRLIVANLEKFHINTADYFTIRATVSWKGRCSSLALNIVKDTQTFYLGCVQFGQTDVAHYRASFGLEDVQGQLGRVSLHSFSESHQRFEPG